MIDLEQYAKSFKASTEPISYLEDITIKSIKICRVIAQEFGISLISCDPITKDIRDSINILVKNCSESIKILNEDILYPIQMFLVNRNLKVEECKYQGKEILDQAIKLYETTEVSKKDYFDTKDTYTDTKNLLAKLENSGEEGKKAKIKAASSIINNNK